VTLNLVNRLPPTHVTDQTKIKTPSPYYVDWGLLKPCHAYLMTDQ